MGSNTSSSSTSSSPDTNSDCYMHNKMMRQQCLQTRSDNTENNLPSTQQSSKTQLGCDCQGNVMKMAE